MRQAKEPLRGELSYSPKIGLWLLPAPWRFPQSDVEAARPLRRRQMRKSCFTEVQIIGMIKEQEAGLPATELC
jgi:hypothetical protein